MRPRSRRAMRRLRNLVKQVAEKPPKGVTEEQSEKARAIIRTSLDQEKTAESATLGVIVRLVRSFRAEHPDWIPEVNNRSRATR